MNTAQRIQIDLVYFDGCPNAEAARASLTAACEQLNLKLEWQEWNQNDDDTPDHLLRFASPSILVDGKDVTGQLPNSDGTRGKCAPKVGQS